MTLLVERPPALPLTRPTAIHALDLFAGTGWGVACQRLGIHEMGVELMPEAIATRTAAGMETVFEDVWDGLEGRAVVPFHDVLIASPPCQTFSMAGGGAGRRALDEVVGLIASKAYTDPAKLREFGETHDPRTSLVLTPLAYAYRFRPRVIIWEQVPTVLPVWEACADELRSWGYSVAVKLLTAEQYGVPQTRKRAILVARWDGEARMPTPTHSRYYSRQPQRLDANVLPWTSMSKALGWGEDEVVTSAQSVAGVGRATRSAAAPGLTVTQTTSRVMRSNYGTGGDPAARGERHVDEPAATVTSKADRSKWVDTRPAPTVVGTRRTAGGMLIGRQLDDGSRVDVGGHSGEVGLRPGMLAGVRVTEDEAAVLQSYPRGFPWQGGKGKRYLQIGNAVPPLLAEAILRAALA
jgi:DNA (cytosine-5)-methyltransferase 1